MSDITLHVNGMKYRGWQDAKATLSMDACFSEFTLQLTQDWPDQVYGVGLPKVRKNDECVLKLNNETVVTGFISRRRLRTDEDGFTLNVSGKDRTALLFKSGVLRDPAEWVNQTPEQIISDICRPFGISVINLAPEINKPFKKFTLTPGETANRAIERVCRHRGLLYFANRLGNLVLATALSASRSSARLLHGKGGNVLGCDLDDSLDNRNSEYIVMSQNNGQDWASEGHTKVTGRAKDHGVKLYSPKVIIADEPEDEDGLTELAITMAAVNAGRGQTIDYPVADWSQGKEAPLWDINMEVPVQDDLEGTNQIRLIKKCVFSVSEKQAAETLLTVTDPKAFTLRAEPEKDEGGWNAS
ncbi:hypothetical protein RYZ26_15280 [Terasakiella sp. A23]|uniref:phage baseplate assembly protein n=1 Tax=Terasakiella sp. FCG-A23 TaxID=3080561 RepID=UPI0029540447|nr:hypothetical protein [Terasakiella sp. A23]MDV7340967.1 hypothetical protein [Terasakiella sp. A23]